jgi:hypothetical protein
MWYCSEVMHIIKKFMVCATGTHTRTFGPFPWEQKSIFSTYVQLFLYWKNVEICIYCCCLGRMQEMFTWLWVHTLKAHYSQFYHWNPLRRSAHSKRIHKSFRTHWCQPHVLALQNRHQVLLLLLLLWWCSIVAVAKFGTTSIIIDLLFPLRERLRSWKSNQNWQSHIHCLTMESPERCSDNPTYIFFYECLLSEIAACSVSLLSATLLF